VALTYHFCYNLAVSDNREYLMHTNGETPIKVLLADDSDIMRDAVRKLLAEEPRIQIVGEVCSFDAVVQGLQQFKPDVLVLDLHMPQKHELQPQDVKSRLNNVKFTVAISFANDEEAKSLAASYGAAALLDKMSLYSQLLPAIERLSEPAPNNSFKLDLQDLQTGREGLSLEAPE
jgi:two-component system response regulator DegU